MSAHSSVTGSVDSNVVNDEMHRIKEALGIDSPILQGVNPPLTTAQEEAVARYGPPVSATGPPGGSRPPGPGQSVPSSVTSSAVGQNVATRPVVLQDQQDTPIMPANGLSISDTPTTGSTSLPSAMRQSETTTPAAPRRVNFTQPVVTSQASPCPERTPEPVGNTVMPAFVQTSTRVPGLIYLPCRSNDSRDEIGYDAVGTGNLQYGTRVDPGVTEIEHLRLVEAETALATATLDQRAMELQLRTLRDQLLSERSSRLNSATDGVLALHEASSAQTHTTSADAQERVLTSNRHANMVVDHLYDVNSVMRLPRQVCHMNYAINNTFNQQTPVSVPIRPIHPLLLSDSSTLSTERPKYPWDKGFNIIRELHPVNSQEAVRGETIRSPASNGRNSATLQPPTTSGQRGHLEHPGSALTGHRIGHQLLSQHTLGQSGQGSGVSGSQPVLAGSAPPPYQQPYQSDPGQTDPGFMLGSVQLPQPGSLPFGSGHPSRYPEGVPVFSRPPPGPGYNGETMGSMGPGSGPSLPGSATRPMDDCSQMPNNHPRKPNYYYGPEPISALAEIADELRRSVAAFQRLPVVSELDKTPAGARNMPCKPYHSSTNIRHWFAQFEVYLCIIRCFHNNDKILQLYYLMSQHNFSFLETLSSAVVWSRYETFKAALLERFKDKQLDQDKLRQVWTIHQEIDGTESVDAYYERFETALVEALPDEHVNTNKVYVTMFENNLRPDIYSKYRDMTTGVCIPSMETARSYASNCEQLLRSHEYLEGVCMHQRSVGKILADSRPATGFGSVPVTYGPRDRDDRSGRFLGRESVPLPSVLRPRVRFRPASPETGSRPVSPLPRIPVASVAPLPPRPYPTTPRPASGNRPPSENRPASGNRPPSTYTPNKINIAYNEIRASNHTFSRGGVPRPTHNGVTVVLGETMWDRWCKEHPPREDRASSRKNFETAMKKNRLLNGKSLEEQLMPKSMSVKTVDFHPAVNVIIPEPDKYENNGGWTEELVQEVQVSDYEIELGYEYDTDLSAERWDVMLNPLGDFYEGSH